MTYDYTGYGISKPHSSSEEDVYADIEFVASFAIEKLKYPMQKIVMWGFSLGCAPVLDISSHFRFGGVITMAPFVSLNSWLYETFSLEKLKLKESSDKFENYTKIPHIESPVLIFHGKSDTVINVSHSRFLKQVCFDFSLDFEEIKEEKEENISKSLPVDATSLIFKERKKTYDICVSVGRERSNGLIPSPLDEKELRGLRVRDKSERESPKLKVRSESILTTRSNEEEELLKGKLELFEVEGSNHGSIQMDVLEQSHLKGEIQDMIFRAFAIAESMPSRVKESLQVDNGSCHFRKIYKNAFVNVNFKDKNLEKLMRDSLQPGNSTLEAESHIKCYLKCKKHLSSPF